MTRSTVRPDTGAGAGATRWLAVLRIVTGLTFCWSASEVARVGAASELALAAGLVCLGVLVTLGIGLRLSAMVGGAWLLGMWLLGVVGGSGAPGLPATSLGGAFPLVSAVILGVLATTFAGRTWGFAVQWAALPVVRRHRWLI
jgi:hypothetical protein